MPQILLFDSRSSITPATWPLSYSTAFYYYTTILRFVKVFGWVVNKIVKYMVLSIVEFIQFDEKRRYQFAVVTVVVVCVEFWAESVVVVVAAMVSTVTFSFFTVFWYA